ncbi:MAG: hypothetical protein WAW37_14670 [Syntrophobacteraceae bacterium]
MRYLKMVLGLIALMALPAGPVAASADRSGPANQCVLLPEIMKGKTASQTGPAIYQPESCITSNFEIKGSGDNGSPET